MISNASKQVASLTTHVSQSLSTAIESIDLSIPNPEDMAKINANEKKVNKEESNEEVSTPKESSENVFSLFSNVTKIGLDTLEGIGKKTINILHETDPSIKSKIRSMGGGSNEPNLSDILKEAKERNDLPSPSSQKQDLKGPISFEHLLDDFKGLVYLEALEILSQQSKMKIELFLKPLAGKALSEMEETIAEVEELCELPDSDAHDETITATNLQEKLLKATEDLNIKLNFNDIVECAKNADLWIETNSDDVNGVYQKTIETLAHLCALSLNNYQKLAEILLSLNHRSTADEADALTQ